jgi:hypothetical protein
MKQKRSKLPYDDGKNTDITTFAKKDGPVILKKSETHDT